MSANQHSHFTATIAILRGLVECSLQVGEVAGSEFAPVAALATSSFELPRLACILAGVVVCATA